MVLYVMVLPSQTGWAAGGISGSAVSLDVAGAADEASALGRAPFQILAGSAGVDDIGVVRRTLAG